MVIANHAMVIVNHTMVIVNHSFTNILLSARTVFSFVDFLHPLVVQLGVPLAEITNLDIKETPS